MRPSPLFLLGFAAGLAHAAPARVEKASPVEKRQFQIGGPTVTLTPGTPNPGIIIPPLPSPTSIFIPGKRAEDVEGEFELDLEERDDDVAELEKQYYDLLKPYGKDKHPPIGVYMVLLHLAEVLASKGVKVDTFVLGKATTIFTPSGSRLLRSRQIFTIGGCRAEDIIGLRTILASLLIIYGPQPPVQIWNLEQAIIAALIACGEKVSVGPLEPEVPIPGGPLEPEVPVPGGPLEPETPVPGGPLEPEVPVPGGPLVPEKPVPGGPIVPEKPVPGGPIKPEEPIEGGPLVPSD